ncbi:MAG: heavy-metal-associated domain-containing protein [Saccharofermentans sp.]|nr:heavy-metal-associated domain-containing protein [Saccharofermentans sp.]
MQIGPVIVALAATALLVWKVKKAATGESTCCGSNEPAPSKVKVKDKDRSHYPYEYTLTIEGMVCSNCVRRVENTLNSMDGMWADADLGTHEVTVLSKTPKDKEFFINAYKQTSYTLTDFKEGTRK